MFAPLPTLIAGYLRSCPTKGCGEPTLRILSCPAPQLEYTEGTLLIVGVIVG